MKRLKFFLGGILSHVVEVDPKSGRIEPDLNDVQMLCQCGWGQLGGPLRHECPLCGYLFVQPLQEDEEVDDYFDDHTPF